MHPIFHPTYLSPTHASTTYHVEFVVVRHEGGHGEGGEAAGGEREVRVDDGAVLVVRGRQRRVEARPVQPQEDRA